MSVYADALLNGVEIFKISSDDGNLTGLTPNRIQVFLPEHTQPIGQPSKWAITFLDRKVDPAVGAGAFTILVLSFLCFLIVQRGRGAFPSSSVNVGYLNTTTGSSSLPSDMCHHFPLAEIKAATNNFDEAFLVGVGGFGNVYRGHMCNGSVSVAIKHLKPGSRGGGLMSS